VFDLVIVSELGIPGCRGSHAPRRRSIAPGRHGRSSPTCCRTKGARWPGSSTMPGSGRR